MLLARNPAVIGDGADSPDAAQVHRTRKLILASAVGTVVEWYDFFLFGLIAPLVFDQLFFPKA